MLDLEQLSGTTNAQVNDDSPAGLRLDLLIDDPETMAALASYPEGRERNRFVRTTLRIGIIALNQAQGRIDTESVKNEGDRMVREMESKLADYRRQTEQLLANTLRDFFDPQNGRFCERVERLVRCHEQIEANSSKHCASLWPYL